MSEYTLKIKHGSVILMVWNNGKGLDKEGKVVDLMNISINKVFKKDDRWDYRPNYREADLDDVIKVIQEYKEKCMTS